MKVGWVHFGRAISLPFFGEDMDKDRSLLVFLVAVAGFFTLLFFLGELLQ
jgi:hypothetical protein